MKYLGKFTGKLYSLEEKQNGLILCLIRVNSSDGTHKCKYSHDREAYLAKLRPKNPIPGRIL